MSFVTKQELKSGRLKTGGAMDLGVDERRVAIEAIATLVHIKRVMADLILKRAGVLPDIYRPLLYRRDESTGRSLSKRQIAPLILDAIDRQPDDRHVIRAIVEIAAHWSSFHLADDEFVARATVQKARELLGTIEVMRAREDAQRELARKEEIGRLERERADLFRRQSDLLLMMFDDLTTDDDAQRRGYLLQELLNRLFDLYEIPVYKSFTRNEGGEQIDGAFRLDGWYYLVECRWRKKLADIRELDGLKGQVNRSGKQTMGLFLAINGWSEHVPTLLMQNPDKSIMLMEGYGLRTILSGQADLQEFLGAMLTKLNLEGEPYLGMAKYLEDQRRP
jgi:hypothetical protein